MTAAGGAYPGLSSLITVGALPDKLEFLSGAVDQLLDGIRYSDLVIDTSPANDAKFYGVTVVVQELALDLLGSGLKLIFFPADDPNAAVSEIPINFSYRWPILRYLPDFETLSFAHSGRAFFDLFLRLVNITREEFLQGLVDALIDDPDPYQVLYAKLSAWQNGASPLGALSLATVPLNETELQHVVSVADDADVDLVTAAFETLVDDIDVDQSIDNVIALASYWLGGIGRDDLEQLLLPQFALELAQVSMAIEVPRSVLVPLKPDGSEDPDPAHSRLIFTAGGVRYDSATGFEINIDENVTADFTPSMIPGVGITLSFEDIKIDLSRSGNIAEATADGRPDDFMGVFIGKAEIGLPKAWFEAYQPSNAPPLTLGIVGRDLLIGTGGFSGLIGLEALSTGAPPVVPPNTPPPELEFILGRSPPAGQDRKGYKLGFSVFDMKFRQNQLLESRIKGSLTVPGFDPADPDGNRVDIELFLDGQGDFEVTASVAGGRLFTVPHVFTFNALSLSVGKNDHGAYLRLTGDLSFAINPILGSLLKQPIHLDKLLIHSDGSVELEGGVVPLPQSVVIAVGPAKIAITAIHFGSHEQEYGGVMRKYRYWGFDGGISVDPGGVDARGDGVCFYYSVDDLPLHTFLRIDGIGIALVIPGSASKEDAMLLLEGYLALKDPVYQGSLKFQLPKLKIAGGAAMKYDTRRPAWIVRVDLELPKALPLGSTGLGVYSFAGLFGLRYIASKQAINPPLADDASWGDYYRAPPARGVTVDKFLAPDRTAGSPNPFSVGVGAGLCTLSDNGKVFSAQLFLLVSLPNLIMLEGAGDVLAKQRVSVADDPPYYAYLALSPGESIELGVGVNYLVPKDTGKVLNLTAVLQAAFFFRNASAWYVNFGTKDKPAVARIIDLFDGYAYLMLSASGIETGAGVSFDFNKHYGPIGVDAHAYLDFWAYLSFERTQSGGGVAMGGYLDVTLFKFGFNISLAAVLTMEAPKPYYVAGSVEVCVSVKLLKKKITKCCTVAFEWRTSDPADTAPVPVMTASGPAAASAVHMVSGSTYEVAFTTSPTPPAGLSPIPLDCYVDVKFTKPVDPSAATGPLIGGYTSAAADAQEKMPPRYGTQIVTHGYTLDQVELQVLQNGGWVDYHPYAALAPDGLLDASVVQQLAAMPAGVWQKQGPAYNQIRFLALTPFSWMGPMVGCRPEEMGVTAQSTYCVGRERAWSCAGWSEPAPYVAGLDYLRDGVLHRVDGDRTAAVALTQPGLAPVSLAIGPSGTTSFQFLEPVVGCRLQLYTAAPSVTVRWQRRKPMVVGGVVVSWPWDPPQFEDVGPALVVQRSALSSPVTYNQPADPIDRVVLETPAPDLQKIAQLQEAIAQRGDDWIRQPKQRDAIQRNIAELQRALQAEHDRTCVADHPAGDKADAKIADLTGRLGRLHDKLQAFQARYQALCGGRVAAEGPAASPAPPRMSLAQAPPGPVEPGPDAPGSRGPDRSRGPTPPPMSPKACQALAQKIERVEARIGRVEDRLATMQAGGGLPPDWTCATFVHEVCWLTQKDYAYNQSLPGLDAIAADYSMMRAAVEGAIAPIWRPGETYRIHLQASDTVCGSPSAPMDYYVHFRTDGPIGHFLVPPSSADNLGPPAGPTIDDGRQEVPERSLRFYIDMQRSFPDPSGALLYAKPLYYQDVELRLFFDRPHAYHFFADWPGNGWKYALDLAVKDPAEAAPPGSNALPHEAAITAAPHLGTQTWLVDAAPKATPELQTTNAFQAAASEADGDSLVCLVTGGDPVAPLSKLLHVEIGDLEPDKLYTAVVLNRRTDTPRTGEVHRYPFRTSRYPSFDAHVASSRLSGADGVERVAAFNLDHALPGGGGQTVAAALAIVSGGPVGDPAAYPDPFDGLIYGLLQLPPLAPAAGVELNFVTALGGSTFGLWIRGPEPLYDPRLPPAVLGSTISLLADAAPVPARVLLSRDCSQAFLMVPAGDFPTQNLAVRFANLDWAGQPGSPASVDTDVFSKT